MTVSSNHPTLGFSPPRIRKRHRHPSLTSKILVPIFCAICLIFYTIRHVLPLPSSYEVTPLLQSSPRSKNASPKFRSFCDSRTIEEPCIYDMGMNKGQSSAFYLRNPAAHVLAIEANPILASKGLQRFSEELASGRFRLLHLGISGDGMPDGPATFWINTLDDKFSSFHELEGCRPTANAFSELGDHRHCRPVQVPTKMCYDILLKHGTPTYLKVDVEGLDRACLQSLEKLPAARRPQYVSKENVSSKDIDLLVQLGYTHFKVVNQQVLHIQFFNDSTMRGTSGHWGEQAPDAILGLGWHTPQQLKSYLPLPTKMTFNGITKFAWYDLHAKFTPSKPTVT